ncbi:MAG: hypothetical protein ACT4OG_05245 [Alphaproteobacteria bacterium]
MNLLRPLTLGLILTAVPALAADNNSQDKQGMNTQDMMGVHEMAGTVTAIDPKTGKLDLDAGGQKLQLHFPPNSLAEVKKGDRITVHLGFEKP